MSPLPYSPGAADEYRIRQIAREEAERLSRSPGLSSNMAPRGVDSRRVSMRLVTQLPAAAQDGDEILFLADETDGRIWHLRYRRDGSSSYPWEYVGGNPLYDYILTQQATSSGSPTNLTTTGPQLTAPLAGDYRLHFGASIQNAGGNNSTVAMAPSIAGSTPAESDGCSVFFTPVSNMQADCATVREYTGWAAMTTVVMKYWISFGATTGYFRGRFLEMTPIRVGKEA